MNQEVNVNSINIRNQELVERLPVIFGGDPNDLKNKLYLSRSQHIQFVKFWNEKISSLRADNK